MSRINYKEDFRVALTLLDSMGEPMPLPDYDYDIILSTDGSGRVYTASSRDGVLTNLTEAEGHIIINADNHGLYPGELRAEFVALLPEEDLPDGTRRVSTVEMLPVTLVEGATDSPTELQASLIAPYIKGEKGDPFTFADFTEEQIGILQKPAKEAADKADSAIATANKAAATAVSAATVAEGAAESARQAAAGVSSEISEAKRQYQTAAACYDTLKERVDELTTSTESKLQELSGTLETGKLAEGLREEAETVRKANEAQREGNETARVAQESERIQGESSRKQDEAKRVANEKARISNEEKRVAAEAKRANAETERVASMEAVRSSETSRTEAEADRVKAEALRDAAEEVRATNETKRKEAETLRQEGYEAIDTRIDGVEVALAGKQSALVDSNDIEQNAAAQLHLTDEAKRYEFRQKWIDRLNIFKTSPTYAADVAATSADATKFGLNGLVFDYGKARKIYAWSRTYAESGERLYNYAEGFNDLDTVFPSMRKNNLSYDSCSHMFYNCRFLKVVNVTDISSQMITPSSVNSMFYLCGVKKVIGEISLAAITQPSNAAGAFSSCASLEEIKIRGIKVNLSFAATNKISYSSLRYMVDHAANTSPITLTLHADVFAKLTAEGDEFAQWRQLAEDAAAKNISFASA